MTANITIGTRAEPLSFLAAAISAIYLSDGLGLSTRVVLVDSGSAVPPPAGPPIVIPANVNGLLGGTQFDIPSLLTAAGAMTPAALANITNRATSLGSLGVPYRMGIYAPTWTVAKLQALVPPAFTRLSTATDSTFEFDRTLLSSDAQTALMGAAEFIEYFDIAAPFYTAPPALPVTGIWAILAFLLAPASAAAIVNGTVFTMPLSASLPSACLCSDGAHPALADFTTSLPDSPSMLHASPLASLNCSAPYPTAALYSAAMQRFLDAGADFLFLGWEPSPLIPGLGKGGNSDNLLRIPLRAFNAARFVASRDSDFPAGRAASFLQAIASPSFTVR